MALWFREIWFILFASYFFNKRNTKFKSLHKNVEISMSSLYLLWWWNIWIWNLMKTPWGEEQGSYSQRRNTTHLWHPSHLGHCDAALLGQLLFGFFTGVGVAEVWVKIFIQDFCGLFTEVTPFSSMKEPKGEQ